MSEKGTDYRYERKFIVEGISPQEVTQLVQLHPAMFYQPYPPRFVNNFYLDTLGMENYYDNVHGAANRVKVRVRWYGDLYREVTKPVLEFKIKRGLVGTKQQFKLPAMDTGKSFTGASYSAVLAQADLPEIVRERMQGLHIVLLNRYWRYYFATYDQRFRITLDTALAFQRVDHQQNRFMHRQQNYRSFVMELKYGVEQDDEANRISSYFPFRVDKSSKYVQGIERVYF